MTLMEPSSCRFDYIQRAIMKDRARAVAFASLAEVVSDVSTRGQFNVILWFCINTSKLLQERKLKGAAVIESALLCFSRIVPYVDPGHLKQGPPFWTLLEGLYELPFSKPLVGALQAVIIHHPAVRMQVRIHAHTLCFASYVAYPTAFV